MKIPALDFIGILRVFAAPFARPSPFPARWQVPKLILVSRLESRTYRPYQLPRIVPFAYPLRGRIEQTSRKRVECLPLQMFSCVAFVLGVVVKSSWNSFHCLLSRSKNSP